MFVRAVLLFLQGIELSKGLTTLERSETRIGNDVCAFLLNEHTLISSNLRTAHMQCAYMLRLKVWCVLRFAQSLLTDLPVSCARK